MNVRKNFKGCLLTWLFCFFSFIASSQQKKEGFLWRITGNGLERPSYLFGTIHLTDKRVFNFGDSVYHAIESSAGYAMELNPDSLMTYYFREGGKEDAAPLLQNLVDPDKFEAAKKKLQKQFGKPAEKVTVKEL